MGRRILLAIVLIVGALLVYNYVTTGRLALMPTATLSEQEKELDALEERMEAAVKGYLQAGRAAGLSGVDTTANVEDARIEIAKVQKRLTELRAKASEQVKSKMDVLQRKLDEVKRELGIR